MRLMDRKSLIHAPAMPKHVFAPSETELYIRFADVDMMQVVHHSAYIHWFEQIRFKFLHDILGVKFEKFFDADIALPLTSCELAYKRSFRFGDLPVGFARIELFKQAKIAFRYEIYNRLTGELCTTGATTHCFLGRGQKLMLRTPTFFLEAAKSSLDRYPDSLVRSKIEHHD